MYILVPCASPDYVCFSRKVIPLEANIIVVHGPPPEQNVDGVVVDTPEPDVDGKCIFCNQSECRYGYAVIYFSASIRSRRDAAINFRNNQR